MREVVGSWRKRVRRKEDLWQCKRLGGCSGSWVEQSQLTQLAVEVVLSEEQQEEVLDTETDNGSYDAAVVRLP